MSFYHLQKCTVLGPKITFDCDGDGLVGDLMEFEYFVHACFKNDDVLGQNCE